MADNPYLLDTPAVVSFSGGRTSGMMLHRVLEAHGGALPDGVKVVFCNTGLEHPKTLDFVAECARRWAVDVVWLEYHRDAGVHDYRRVDRHSANADGTPFRAACEARRALPNVMMRFCTGELKCRTTRRFLVRELGWPSYRNAIGFRRDEPRRVAKLADRWLYTYRRDEWRAKWTVPGLFGPAPRNRHKKPEPLFKGEHPTTPLNAAGVTLAGVDAVWAGQPFRLGIDSDRGNCSLCFLKGTANIIASIRDDPTLADWWVEMEAKKLGRSTADTFRNPKERPNYATLRDAALGRVPMPLFDDAPSACDFGGCTD